MSDESPPPYSAVVSTSLVPQNDPPNGALPFSRSDSLAANVLGLISKGKSLDSRFKDVRDITSAGATFEYQHAALTLCQRFETLLWESRNMAGAALVSLKDFNEVVLDFLSDPDIAVESRLKELSSASNLLQRERVSLNSQKSSLDALVRELEGFYQMVRSESGAPNPKKRRQSHSGEKGTRGAWPSRKPRFPIVMPRPEPLNSLSTVTASIGAFSRTCKDYALQFESMAEKAVFPSLAKAPPDGAQETSLAAPTSQAQRKRLYPLVVQHAEWATLPSVVGALVDDLGAFGSHIDVFDTILTELAREQDIVVVYLKDGQSAANQGYRFEIKRLRRHLPCVCSALDAYSKGKLP